MDLYYHPRSPPCRSVLMTARALGVEVNIKHLDPKAGEHMNPKFLKVNPQHSIPTLVDGDFAVWESRAIMIYLVEKYGKEDDPLYPKCPKKRALINQRLYFDMGNVYANFAAYYFPTLKNKIPGDPELLKKFEATMDFLNTFLSDSQYAAGDVLTLADLALLASVSAVDVLDIDISKYENVAKWYAKIKDTVPGAAENWAGCLELKKYFE